MTTPHHPDPVGRPGPVSLPRLAPALALARHTRLSLLVAAALLSACANSPLSAVAPVPSAAAARPDLEALPAAVALASLPAPRQNAPLPGRLPASSTSGLAGPNADMVTSGDEAAVAFDPLRPTERLNLDAAAARTDLWARVRIGLAVPDLNNDLVRKWEQWYASKPEYVARMTERGGRYLFHIVEELNKRGLPTELALLPFIESGFNPQALSSAKASGMWQFVPATGRDFSLRQNMFRDDRRDVLASTRAALNYLQTLHTMFGDWQLALAAYNWGQGSVQRAIKRNLAAGLPTDYASLSMPDETRNYYPKLQAVKNIVLRPDAFAITLPTLRNHPYFVSVGLKNDIDTDLAARLAGLPLAEFKQLNPQMNKPVILASVTPQVLLPYDNANRFVHALGQHRGGLASLTAWKAPKTLRPAQAASLVGMSEARLRELNNIPKGMVVKAGSTLLVARSAQRTADVPEQMAEQAVLTLARDTPPARKVRFKAGKKGDTVLAVARRYRVSPQQVALWNGTSAGGRFAPGQAVTVMVPVRPGKVGLRMAKGKAGKRLGRTAAGARVRVAQG